ncbi:hypothetical protein JCM19235_3301 [Vibrio maritimus]|uniref:Uncharacterized protein n=1 Tax=Vibrio maritimus TaxID=990268 RepID=A0A090S534_9VIBR|nr:hypothetical protein JCM19235_3301 [Vibrio maritimus]
MMTTHALLGGESSLVHDGLSSHMPSPNDNQDKPTPANTPSKLNFNWQTICRNGKEFTKEYLPKFKKSIGAVRSSSKRDKVFDSVIASLVHASNHNKQVIYSRRKTSENKEYRTLVKTADFLHQSGLIINVVGANNEYNGISSYMIPTDKFQQQVSAFDMSIALQKDAPMIEVRKDGKALSLNRIETRSPLQVKKLSAPVEAYNTLWLEHEATLEDKPLVPFCKRIFSKDLSLGGRWYGSNGSHETLPKHLRAMIKIDGKHTCEPDYKSLHFCLLYAMVGIAVDPLTDDPYDLDGFSRDTAKSASLVLLNSNDLGRFKANVTKSGSPETKARYNEYKTALSEHNKSKGNETNRIPPYKPKQLQGFIDGMPDGIIGDEFLSSFLAKHSAIKHLIGSPDIGLRLQYQDSQIMRR